MDNEKEIPFGAFDSELMRQEITIPEGFEATIDGNKIILKKIESEDERIRKELIEHVKDQQSSFISAPDCRDKYEEEENNKYNSWLSWLEKQGEQKPIMNVPPREVILSIWDLGNEWKELTNGRISTEYGTQLDYIQKHWHESEYYLREKQGEQKVPIEKLPEEIKTIGESLEFTTQEECDEYNQMVSDLIMSDNKVKPKFHEGEWVVFNDKHESVYQIEKIENFQYTLRHILGGSMPLSFSGEDMIRPWAIQDARDGDVLACNEEILLFKSYSVQGRVSLYCWYNGQTNNFHSKEVVDTLMTTRNKIYPATKEQRDLLFQKMKEAGYTFDFEKKELKKISQRMISAEAKEAMYGQPAWSEEDKTKIKSIIALLKSPALCAMDGNKCIIDENIKYLKSFRDKVQPKQEWSEEDMKEALRTEYEKGRADAFAEMQKEWSEEDEELLNIIIDNIRGYDAYTGCIALKFGLHENKIKWLKLLKDRVQPKNHWKPSDEQMEALNDVISLRDIKYDVLSELWKDLSKLKGE